MSETVLAGVEVPSLRRTRSAKSKTQAKGPEDEQQDETLVSSPAKRTRGAKTNAIPERGPDERSEVTPRKRARSARGKAMGKAPKPDSDSDGEAAPRKKKVGAGSQAGSDNKTSVARRKAAEKNDESITQASKRSRRSHPLSSMSPLPPSPELNAETHKKAKTNPASSEYPLSGNQSNPSGPSRQKDTFHVEMNDLHPTLEPQLNGRTKTKEKNKEKKKKREPSLALELSDVELDEQTLEAFIDFVDHLPEKKESEEDAEGSDAEEEFVPTPLPQK